MPYRIPQKNKMAASAAEQFPGAFKIGGGIVVKNFGIGIAGKSFYFPQQTESQLLIRFSMISPFLGKDYGISGGIPVGHYPETDIGAVAQFIGNFPDFFAVFL